MRITDMLQTETPRPCLDDPIFTDFDGFCPNPTVINGTDVDALFMQMTLGNNGEPGSPLRRDIIALEDDIGEGVGWQFAQFFHFDWSTLGCVAPPFDNFVIEFDHRDAMMKAAQENGIEPDIRRFMHVGRTAASFTVIDREQWLTNIVGKRSLTLDMSRIGNQNLKEIEALPFRWMYTACTWRYEPGIGLRGPISTWIIPVDEHGMLFIDHRAREDRDPTKPLGTAPKMLHALNIGPDCDEFSDGPASLSQQYCITQGWTVMIPALLTLSLMHTPKATKDREGLHEVIDGEMPGAKIQRRYLAKHFRPMVRWHTLDITGLRTALKESNGGEYPKGLESFAKALHGVRGFTRTYMPNTYFGRKHERPITVFTPAHNRGNVKRGVVQKDYRVVSS